jgi:hypothetical protein
MSGVVESKGTLQDSVEFLTNLRQIVTPEEAERYWKIFPPSQAENVVAMASAS